MKLDIQLVWIAIGGAMGALSRFAIAEYSKRWFDGRFPVGTLLANLLGCYLIGILVASDLFEKNQAIRLGLGVGFLGALTTFSTFGAETIKHLENGDWWNAGLNVLLNVVLGLLCVFLGMMTSKKLF